VRQGLARKVIKATQRKESTRLTGSSQEWDEDAEGTLKDAPANTLLDVRAAVRERKLQLITF